MAPGCCSLHPLGAREQGGDPARARGVGEPAPSCNEKVLKDKLSSRSLPPLPGDDGSGGVWGELAAGRDPGKGLQHPGTAGWVSGCPRLSGPLRQCRGSNRGGVRWEEGWTCHPDAGKPQGGGHEQPLLGQGREQGAGGGDAGGTGGNFPSCTGAASLGAEPSPRPTVPAALGSRPWWGCSSRAGEPKALAKPPQGQRSPRGAATLPASFSGAWPPSHPLPRSGLRACLPRHSGSGQGPPPLPACPGTTRGGSPRAIRGGLGCA